MKLLLLSLNIIFIVVGGAGFGYMLFSVDVTEMSNTIIALFIISVSFVVWGLVTTFMYWFRAVVLGNNSIQALIRSQRQGFLLGAMTAVQLTLLGSLLWNIFSASILGLVILLLEYYFLSHETQS